MVVLEESAGVFETVNELNGMEMDGQSLTAQWIDDKEQKEVERFLATLKKKSCSQHKHRLLISPPHSGIPFNIHSLCGITRSSALSLSTIHPFIPQTGSRIYQ